MTGGEAAVRTLAAAGVEVCFANPGTAELAFVTALDVVRGVRPCSASSRECARVPQKASPA